MKRSVYIDHFLFLLMILLVNGLTISSSGNDSVLTANLIHFCRLNGMKYLVFCSMEDENPGSDRFLKSALRESKVVKSLRSRRLYHPKFENGKTLDYHHDNLVIVTSGDVVSFKSGLSLISETKIMTSILLIITPINDTKLHEIEVYVRQLSRNMYFYLMFIHQSHAQPVLNRVISLQNNPKIIMQQVNLITWGQTRARYDMEGIHLKCLTLPWPPHINLINCNSSTSYECNSIGYLPDIFRILEKRLNFTWHCDAEPNNDWGVIPISSPANVSGLWGGVVGKVANGDYPFSMAQWYNIESRRGMFDFVNVGKDFQFMMALNPRKSKYDSSLYIRPFTREVWLSIGMLTMLIIFLMLVSYGFSTLKFGKYKTENSFRMIRVVGWMAWVLFIAYYGGALKMFFTTEFDIIPFESQRGVILAYPEWKMKFRKGNEKLFFRKLGDNSDKIYDEFWERTKNSPKEVIYKNIEDGIKQIFDDRVVIHAMDSSLRQYYKQHSKTRIRVPKVFQSEGERLGSYFIVTENSPIGPLLGHELRKLWEKGIFDIIDLKWIGKPLTGYTQENLSSSALSEGQVMLIFSCLCAAIGASMATLLVEHIYCFVKTNHITINIFQMNW